MYTRKIKIKDEKHLKEVASALKIAGEKLVMSNPDKKSIKSLWWFCCSNSQKSFWSAQSAAVDVLPDVPEFEIITKISYELEEVPSISCKACGKKHYTNSETFFTIKGKLMVGISGEVIGNNIKEGMINSSYYCKECLIKLLENLNK